MSPSNWTVLAIGFGLCALVMVVFQGHWAQVPLIFTVIVSMVGVARSFALRRLKQWPLITEEAFKDVFAEQFSGDPNLALAERKRIAKIIGVPFDRISPNHSLHELSISAGHFLGNGDPALGDLEYELEEEAQGTNTPAVQPEMVIGQYIEAVLRARGANASSTKA
jgi:hypothetical protein